MNITLWPAPSDRKTQAPGTEVIHALGHVSEDALLTAYNEVSEARTKLEKVGEIEKLLRDKEDYLRTARQLLNEKYNE